MSEQDNSDPGDWDSELDDVDLCCSSPSSAASCAESPRQEEQESRQPQAAGRAPAAKSGVESDPTQQKSITEESGESSSASGVATSRFNSFSNSRPTLKAARPRNGGVDPGAPLFALALSEASSSSKPGVSFSLKSLPSKQTPGQLVAAEQPPAVPVVPSLHRSSAATGHDKLDTAALQEPKLKGQQQQYAQKHHQQHQEVSHGSDSSSKFPVTRIPALSLTGSLTAVIANDDSDSTGTAPAAEASSTTPAAAAAAAAATAALMQGPPARLPSPGSTVTNKAVKGSSVPSGNSNTGKTPSPSLGSMLTKEAPQSSGSSTPAGHRSSHRSLHTPAPTASSARGAKPPPLALFTSSTSTGSGDSPYATATARASLSLTGPASCGAAAGPSGWAGINSRGGRSRNSNSGQNPSLLGPQNHSTLQGNGRQLVKVQVLLPALEVWLPSLGEEHTAAVGSAQQQAQPPSPGSKSRSSSTNRLQRSDSGTVAAGRSRRNSKDRNSLEGNLLPDAGTTAGDTEQSCCAAAEELQRAVSRALGVESSHLTYFAVQQSQLPQLLQQQQQQVPSRQIPETQPSPENQHTQQKLSRSSSSNGKSVTRARSRGPSPLRGSASGNSSGATAGSNGARHSANQQQQALPQVPTSNELTVVVGFKQGSCGFSLGKLEEVLQQADSQTAAAEHLQQLNKELQENLLRSKTQTAELAGDLARLQQAHDHTSHELHRSRAALSEARAELVAAGDQFVKLEAMHKATARGARGRSNSSSPRKGSSQPRGSRQARGASQSRSSSQTRGGRKASPAAPHHQQPQQTGLCSTAAEAAAAAALEVEHKDQQQQQQQQVLGGVAGGLLGADALKEGISPKCADLMSLMSRINTPGFLNFIHSFLTLYEQQSGGLAADLAAMATNAAAGLSPFAPAAAPAAAPAHLTSHSSNGSTTSRSRTPKQPGTRNPIAAGSLPPGGLQQHLQQLGTSGTANVSSSAALVAEVYGVAGGVGSGSGRPSFRHKAPQTQVVTPRSSPGVPTLRLEAGDGLMATAAGVQASTDAHEMQRRP